MTPTEGPHFGRYLRLWRIFLLLEFRKGFNTMDSGTGSGVSFNWRDERASFDHRCRKGQNQVIPHNPRRISSSPSS